MATTLTFGKYKGQLIDDVPPGYVIWLCCWRVEYDDDDEGGLTKFGPRNSAQEWLLKTFPSVVQAARNRVKNERLCHLCGKPLVPIGNARSNGRPHDDWASRTLHKKCWLLTLADSESD